MYIYISLLSNQKVKDDESGLNSLAHFVSEFGDIKEEEDEEA